MVKRKRTRIYPHMPNYATPPGYVLQDYLEAWGFTPAEFARKYSLATELIEGVVAGKAPIDEELAAIFGREFSLDPNFWFDAEADYRRRLKQLEEKDRANTVAN